MKTAPYRAADYLGDKADVGALVSYAAELEIENERLRAALKSIAGMPGSYDLSHMVVKMTGIAVEALNQQQENVTPSRGCVCCALRVPLHEDARGFHHVVKGERVTCSVQQQTEEK